MHVRTLLTIGLRFGTLAIVTLVAGMGSPLAEAQQTQGEAAQVRELAERLLVQPYPYAPTANAQPPTAHLLPGQVPTDLPLDVPVPPGGRLVGSLVRTGGGPASTVEIVIDAPGTPQQIQRFYADAFATRGWTPPSYGGLGPFGAPGGGFQSASPFPISSMFCQDNDDRYATLTVRQAGSGPADVRLNVSQPVASSASGGGPSYTPCSPPPTPPFSVPFGPAPAASFTNPIPPLTPPEGVQLRTTGGGGGGNGWSSEAVAQTDISAADLEADLSLQLEDAGWTKVDGGIDGPAAWSTWDVPADGNWQGLLFIVELPAENQRALSIRAYSTSGGFGPGPFYGPFPY